MRHVSLVEAKSQLSALIDAVEKGEEIVITRHGKPAAKLSSPRPVSTLAERRALGRVLVSELDAMAAARGGKPPPTVTWEELKAEMEDELG